MRNGSPPFSVDRAFVVQFGDDIDIGKARVFGRVEHIATGKSTRFRSLAELLEFIERLVEETATRGNQAKE